MHRRRNHKTQVNFKYKLYFYYKDVNNYNNKIKRGRGGSETWFIVMSQSLGFSPSQAEPSKAPAGTGSPSLSPSEGSKDKGAVSPPKQKAVMPNAKEAD